MDEISVRFYESVPDERLKFAVIAARYDGRWIWCRHKERDTYEIPGGHREPGENITDTAKRELYEETGAVRFDISPICVYAVEKDGEETCGMLFFAEVYELEAELHSEIEAIELFDGVPDRLTYPLIQPFLHKKAEEYIKIRGFCSIIKKQAGINFINLETAIKTYDRNALVCGVPAWRYVYHTIHSADKWFFDPCAYDEPDFHEDGMDNPDNPCSIVLSDEQLLDYLHRVRDKTLAYMDSLTDEALYEKPGKCKYTRFELVLMQFRHISVHTGMLNGLTIEKTGRFPVYVGADGYDRLKKGLFDD